MRKLRPMMSRQEFERLMKFSQARKTHQEHQIRSSPSRRSSKHPSVGQVFKSSKIVSAPNERLFTSPHTYKSVGPDFVTGAS